MSNPRISQQEHPESPPLGAHPPPFFIVGPPRSGTTLVAAILNTHPRIAVYRESQFYPIFRSELDRYGDLHRRANLNHLMEDVQEVLRQHGQLAPFEVDSFIAQLASHSFEAVFETLLHRYAEQEGKARCGEKTPAHVEFLPEIMERLPASPVVFMIRDPRDVFPSVRKAFGTSIQTACWNWNRAYQALRNSQGKVHLVRYEDLVRSPEEVLVRLCAHLGEDFDARLLQFNQQYDRRDLAPHHRNLHRPIGTGSVGRFRDLPPDTLEWIESACAEGMRALDYDLATPASMQVDVRPPRGWRLLWEKGRYYGLDRQRWRWGFMRWRILLRLRLRATGRQ